MARQVKISKKDLKDPDQFISTTEVVLAYCSHHLGKLVGVGVAIVLLVGGVIGFRYYDGAQSLHREAQIFEMEQIRAGDKKPEEVASSLEKILSDISEGDHKQRARLLLADSLYQNKEYDKAIQIFNEVLAAGGEKLSHHMALVGLAYSLEGKKEYPKAIDAYKKIIDENANIPLLDIYMGLSRCYEMNSDPKGALQVLREAQNKFAGHALMEIIDRQISKLSAVA